MAALESLDNFLELDDDSFDPLSYDSYSDGPFASSSPGDLDEGISDAATLLSSPHSSDNSSNASLISSSHPFAHSSPVLLPSTPSSSDDSSPVSLGSSSHLFGGSAGESGRGQSGSLSIPTPPPPSAHERADTPESDVPLSLFSGNTSPPLLLSPSPLAPSSPHPRDTDDGLPGHSLQHRSATYLQSLPIHYPYSSAGDYRREPSPPRQRENGPPAFGNINPFEPRGLPDLRYEATPGFDDIIPRARLRGGAANVFRQRREYHRELHAAFESSPGEPTRDEPVQMNIENQLQSGARTVEELHAAQMNSSPIELVPVDDENRYRPRRRRLHEMYQLAFVNAVGGSPGDELVLVDVENRQQPRRPLRVATAAGAAQGHTEFIDLTDDPDSPPPRIPPFPQFALHSRNRRLADEPVEITQASRESQGPAQQSQHRNPRRQMSLNGRTPSLARSDGSLLGTHGGSPRSIIDLTRESPEPIEPMDGPPIPPLYAPIQRPVPNNAPNHNSGILGGGAGAGSVGREPMPRGFFNGAFHRMGRVMGYMAPQQVNEMRLEVEVIAPQLDDPLPNIHLNYYHHHRAEAPRPPHEPPSAPRDGFTRATGDDLAVVCPQCDEELKYDPDNVGEDGPPAKRARTRKDREEHHFWAVKACGHVSCLFS